MIPVKSIIADFKKMLADKWGYIPATAGILWTQGRQNATENAMAKKYGSKWIGHMVADCSGAFVYVYRQYKDSIYHGSNRIARMYVEELLPPEMAKPGMAAFKFYKPGQKGYNLPAAYTKGSQWYNGDLNDYYHIGLVDEDPRYILNSATTQNGFIRSKISNGWNAVGYLKNVDYGTEKEPMQDTNLFYANADKVNVRSAPNGNASRVIYLNGGDVVTKLSEASGWSYVRFNGKTGYVMSKYLSPVKAEEPQAPTEETKEEKLTRLAKESREALAVAEEYMNKSIAASEEILQLLKG